MKSNNNKDWDIEAQTFDNDTSILSNTAITRNVKMILSFLLFQAIIVLSMLFMFQDTTTNDLQYHQHGRTPLAEVPGYESDALFSPFAGAGVKSVVHTDPLSLQPQAQNPPELPSHKIQHGRTPLDCSGSFHFKSTAEKCCGKDNIITFYGAKGTIRGKTRDQDKSFGYKKYRCRMQMDEVVQFSKDVSISLFSDFEYDDIVFISSFLRLAAEKLSEDPQNPTLDSIIDDVQIAYFADSNPKKDGGGLWLKKLKVAQDFFPKEVYDKIVIRWKDDDIPGDYTQNEADQIPAYDAQAFVQDMKHRVDMIVICGGQGNLEELNAQMVDQKKRINRMIMSVGGVNIREDQTTDSDMKVLFEWGKKSVLRHFVDSSRYPWMGNLPDPSDVHALGGKQEMEQLLMNSGSYHIVMDYLAAFNLGMIYNGDYTDLNGTEPINKEIVAKILFLRQNGFHEPEFKELCWKILQAPKIKGFYKSPELIDIAHIQDVTNKANWNITRMDDEKVWATFKLNKVLLYLRGEPQDGPAADPVIADWHWNPEQHEIVHGHMMEGCNFPVKQTKPFPKVQQGIAKKFGLVNSGLRMMVTNDKFDQIRKEYSDCTSRGPIFQLRLKQQYLTKDPEEFISRIKPSWQKMFKKALQFRDMK